MRAILIHFLDSDTPVFQFVGDSEREVAFLRDWVDKNLNIKVEGQIPALVPAEPTTLAGGNNDRLDQALTKIAST
jgi:hypothetical protein